MISGYQDLELPIFYGNHAMGFFGLFVAGYLFPMEKMQSMTEKRGWMTQVGGLALIFLWPTASTAGE